MHSFFIENNLISSNQSGFKQGDSCINQFLSITHDIYQSLDQGHEVCSVFLHISKAFDKVSHKLKQNGFLKLRKQKVVPNGLHSSLTDVFAGVPQGSILGPPVCFLFISMIYLMVFCITQN